MNSAKYTIKPKATKRCKPNHKLTYGFESCGDIKEHYKYGLCRDCYFDWLKSTPEGIETALKMIPRAKKKVEKEHREQTRAEKEAVKTLSDLKGKLEEIINEIVRLIDVDKGCISCDYGWGGINGERQFHAGHRISVGANDTIRFNVLNIYKQCSICNNWKSSNEREYDKGLIKHYNEDVLEIARGLTAKYPSLHLTKADVREAIIRAREIRKSILCGKDYTREEINDYIGIY